MMLKEAGIWLRGAEGQAFIIQNDLDLDVYTARSPDLFERFALLRKGASGPLCDVRKR